MNVWIYRREVGREQYGGGGRQGEGWRDGGMEGERVREQQGGGRREEERQGGNIGFCVCFKIYLEGGFQWGVGFCG